MAIIDVSGLERFLEKLRDLIHNNPVHVATSNDGIAYTTEISGITELYVGLEITIKPDRMSASTTPTLNVNGLGAKGIRQRIPYNTSATAVGLVANWMLANKPLTLQYDGMYWKTMHARTDANSVYGVVKVENGGTGANNATTALSNLGGASLEYVNAQIAELKARIEALEQ